jgi:ABC-2 type transport system ATP-binding protein
MIEIRQVTKRYGEKEAVCDLNLNIRQGEIFAFLGPNGAGKTTTIKMMVGLLRPTHGTLRLAGHDVVTQSRLAKAASGYVPDQPILYDKLTGREFLEFVAELYGLSGKQADNAIAQQTSVFDLSEFIDDLTEGYSHGMKQRLVFASAMLHKPRVIILDEPLVGLDPRSIRMVKDLLRSVAREGTTVFMSTHTLAVAEEIAERIGVIHHGRLSFLGTKNELSERLARRESSLEDLFLQLTEESPAAN